MLKNHPAAKAAPLLGKEGNWGESFMEKNNRKEIFGWMVYDWANSAFFTTTIGVLLGPFMLGLAEKALGPDGIIFDLGIFKVTPKGFPAFCTAISVISMVMFLPVLGAIADYTNLKKKMMAVFC